MQCKYCNNEVLDNASFCSNCGSTVEVANKNVFVNSFISIFKGFINPNSFVRNSKIFEVGKTGIISGLIILLTLGQAFIFSKSTVGSVVGYFIGGMNTSILISLVSMILNIAISSLVVFAIIKIRKANGAYIQILNFEIYAYLILAIFSFIGMLLNFISLHLIAVMVIIYGSLLYTLALIQGIKSIWNQNTRWAFLIYILRIVAMAIVNTIVMQLI